MSENRETAENSYLDDVRDFIKDDAEEDADQELDFLKDIPHVDPTVEQTRTMVQEEITKAMETLSETDQDIFETTQLIHINREISGEQLVNHAITMQKIGNRKQDRTVKTVTGLVIVGTLICAYGLFANRMNKTVPSAPVAVEEADPNKVDLSEDPVAITSEVFEDEAFREWISDSCDTDNDGKLSPEERNNTLILLCAGNDRIESVKGIELFPQLQAINVSNTKVTSLDTKNNVLLQYVNVCGTAIEKLDLRDNTSLTEVNMSKCTALTNVLLPEPSQVTVIDTAGSSMHCDADNEGNFTACRVSDNNG